MSKELVKKENNYLPVSKEVLEDFLFSTGAKDLTEEQKKLFLNIAIRNNLDPFKREIYAIPYKNKSGKTELSIITGYQTYIKRAEMSGKLNGWKVNNIRDNKGNVIGAKVVIYRKDWEQPFEWEAYLKEFKKNSPVWREMPEFMIRKVAIAQAFRLCFPTEIGGLPYTPEEVNSSLDEKIEIVEEENSSNNKNFDREAFIKQITELSNKTDKPMQLLNKVAEEIGVSAVDIKDKLTAVRFYKKLKKLIEKEG